MCVLAKRLATRGLFVGVTTFGLFYLFGRLAERAITSFGDVQVTRGEGFDFAGPIKLAALSIVLYVVLESLAALREKAKARHEAAHSSSSRSLASTE